MIKQLSYKHVRPVMKKDLFKGQDQETRGWSQEPRKSGNPNLEALMKEIWLEFGCLDFSAALTKSPFYLHGLFF